MATVAELVAKVRAAGTEEIAVVGVMAESAAYSDRGS